MEQWLRIQFYIFSLALIIVTLYELLQFESYSYYTNTPELLPGLIQTVSFVNMTERTY